VQGATYRPVRIRQPPSLAGGDLSLEGAEVPLGFIEVGLVPEAPVPVTIGGRQKFMSIVCGHHGSPRSKMWI
jgi:hypothetical protein